MIKFHFQKNGNYQKYYLQNIKIIHQLINNRRPSREVALKLKNKPIHLEYENFNDYSTFSKLKDLPRSSNANSTLDFDPWKHIEINSMQLQVKLQGVDYSENILESQYKVDYNLT